jgi:hypothetical protein
VTTAGAEVQGPDVEGEGFFVRALSTNTGKMYVGNNGSGVVSSTTGYELSAGDQVYLDIPNLKLLWVDGSVNGEKVCWLKAKSSVRP